MPPVNSNPYSKMKGNSNNQLAGQRNGNNKCAKKTDWSSEYGYLPNVMVNGSYRMLENIPDLNQQNFVFSPLSIFSAMGALIRGSKGKTNKELVQYVTTVYEI